jgi:hypothetical protein
VGKITCIARYIISDWWEHIFSDGHARVTRWVFDTASSTLVAMQIRDGYGDEHPWQEVNETAVEDVLDSLLYTNSHYLNNPIENDLTLSNRLPTWEEGEEESEARIDQTGTGGIAEALRIIHEDRTDLDALEEQTSRVVANLERIAELMRDEKVADAMRRGG